MKQRGGFVPNVVTYPARLLNPLWARSLGRSRHRTRVPFPRCFGSEKRRLGIGLTKAGGGAPISLRTGPRFVASVRAKGVRAVLSERAGDVTSLGTKPSLYFIGTLRIQPHR